MSLASLPHAVQALLTSFLAALLAFAGWLMIADPVASSDLLAAFAAAPVVALSYLFDRSATVDNMGWAVAYRLLWAGAVVVVWLAGMTIAGIL